MPTPSSFLRAAVQSRTARIAVGASTVRGRGHAGVVAAARHHFATLDLRLFRVSQKRFPQTLDRETASLQQALPAAARHFGIARKLLNIFLRDCLYTTQLGHYYGLDRLEPVLEIPLDSITAQALKKSSGRGTLPQWPGVKHLTPALSSIFQAAALVQARAKGIDRVHLDAVWWSLDRDGP